MTTSPAAVQDLCFPLTPLKLSLHSVHKFQLYYLPRSYQDGLLSITYLLFLPYFSAPQFCKNNMVIIFPALDQLLFCGWDKAPWPRPLIEGSFSSWFQRIRVHRVRMAWKQVVSTAAGTRSWELTSWATCMKQTEKIGNWGNWGDFLLSKPSPSDKISPIR